MECTKHTKEEHELRIDGKKVKMARTEKDWTLTKLSYESGVTRKTIGEIEKENKKRIRYSTMLQLAITLGKEVEDFCTLAEKKSRGENLNEF